MKKTLNNFIDILWLFPEEKSTIKIFTIIFLLIVGSLLEFLNLAFIVPLLSKMTNQSISEKSFMGNYYNFFKEVSLVQMLIIIVIIVFLKSVIQFFGLYFQNKFSHRFEVLISNYLFEKGLKNDYQNQLKNNTSYSQNEIINYPFNINRFFILPMFVIISDLVILSSILIFLFLFNPLVSCLSLIFFGTSIVLYNSIVARKFIRWGEIKLNSNKNRLKIIQESFGAFIDITLLDKSNFFNKKYEEENQTYARVGTFHNSFNQIPKFYFEILIYSFLLGIVYFLSFYSSEQSLILTLGVFAASLMKIIPSFNKLAASYQSIKFSQSSIEILKNEQNLKQSTLVDSTQLDFKNHIEIQNLSFSYNDGDKKVLDNINFTLKKNTCFGIIGESGRGKTTLVNILLGLLRQTTGNVLLDGKPIKTDTVAWQRKIGYVPQNIYLLDAPLIQNIAFGIPENQIDFEKVMDVIDKAQLSSYVKNKRDLYRKVGERGLAISGGQVQRIGIARALYNNPEILIFDESTSALDNQTQDQIIKTIEQLKKNKTIIIISHDLSMINYCDFKFKL